MTYHCAFDEGRCRCWWKEKVAKIKHLLRTDSGDGHGNSKPRSPKFISFLSFIRQVILNDLGDRNDIEDKLCSRRRWWKRWIWACTTNNLGKRNSNSTLRPPKLISFSLFIRQVILNDLQLHLWLQLMSSLMNLMKRHNLSSYYERLWRRRQQQQAQAT